MSLEAEVAVWGLPGIDPLSDAQYLRFQELILRRAGIFLGDHKKALLVGRLSRRLRELGLRSFGEYLERVERSEEERIEMFDAICTNETHFFREPDHFELLRERVFAEWEREAGEGRREKRLRIWSAACSSGEEPYTLAMLLLERFPASGGWAVEVVGTDLSTRILERARQATYSLEKAREIPAAYLDRFMLKGVGEEHGRMKAGREIRSVVRLARVNLNEPLPALGPFDAVFCRNVLIYFNPEVRSRVTRALLGQLRPGGLLFLGHAENLSGLEGAARVIPSVYRAVTPAPACAPRLAASA